jgi:hypothetical protein
VITSNIDTLQKRLISTLTTHANAVSSLNDSGKHDWARSAEYFFQAIAMLVFDEPFELADLKKKNNPIYDLESSTKLIQVTSQLTSEKIKKTLKAKQAGALRDDPRPIYFFLIGDRPKNKKNTFSNLGFCQSKIWGTKEVVDAVCAKGVKHLRWACQIAEDYLIVESAERQLGEADMLHQIESLMEEVRDFRDAQKDCSRADLARNTNDGTYTHYIRLMQLFNEDMERLFRESARIHEAIISEGYAADDARMDYHTLRRLFIEAKASFKSVLPGIKSTVNLKQTIDQLERALANEQRINAELSAIQTRSRETKKQIASLEFEESFMSHIRG